PAQTANQNTSSSGARTNAQGSNAAAGLSIQIKARGESAWLRTTTDDGRRAETILRPNETKEFKPEQRLKVEYARARANTLEITINGRPARVPSDAKSNIAELIITRENYEQLLQ
ncbi:MAG TPA: RodZ domain-containing protein, partial [Pyrinomonadaceae bacterium]